MTALGMDPSEFAKALAPHQVAFVEAVCGHGGTRVRLLRAQPGMGKTVALAAAASRWLLEQPVARVLVLLPAGACLPYMELLRDRATRALLVDRYQFRELLDSASGDEVWPAGVVIVMSRDLAKQDDVRDSLIGTSWDMVIADEAQGLTGVRAEVLRSVGASARRVVLAAATPLPSDLTSGFTAADTTLVHWRREQVVNQDGTPLLAPAKPLVHEVRYSLAAGEESLARAVLDLSRSIEGLPLGAMSLFRALRSSPVALEAVLGRYATGIPRHEAVEASTVVVEDDAESGMAPVIAERVSDVTRELAQRALGAIDAIQSDSKLNALSELIGRLTDAKARPVRICVLTEYVATLFYVATAIEANGLQCQVLHGAMRREERRESLSRFSDTTGVLVATRAVVSDTPALGQVTDLVLYDEPARKLALHETLGQFDRVDRASRLSIHVLSPSAWADGSGLESGDLMGVVLDWARDVGRTD